MLKPTLVGIAACLSVLLVVLEPAVADPFVVTPPGTANAEGNSNNCFPFACAPMTFQQIYDGSLFGGASGDITAIGFRPDANFHAPFDQTMISQAIITLAYAATNASGISGTFANNFGSPGLQVFTGQVAISSNGSGPQIFSMINLDTSFAYDGVGSLLLQIVTTTNSTNTFSLDAASGIPGVRRAWAAGVGATSGQHDGGSFGLVTAFQFGEPTGVPAPGALALLGLGLAGIAGLRRRKTAPVLLAPV